MLVLHDDWLPHSLFGSLCDDVLCCLQPKLSAFSLCITNLWCLLAYFSFESMKLVACACDPVKSSHQIPFVSSPPLCGRFYSRNSYQQSNQLCVLLFDGVSLALCSYLVTRISIFCNLPSTVVSRDSFTCADPKETLSQGLCGLQWVERCRQQKGLPEEAKVFFQKVVNADADSIREVRCFQTL